MHIKYHIIYNIDKIFYKQLYNIYDIPCLKIMRYDYCLIANPYLDYNIYLTYLSTYKKISYLNFTSEVLR